MGSPPDEQMFAMYFPDHHRRGRLCKGHADHEARYQFSIDDKLEGNDGSIYENNKEVRSSTKAIRAPSRCSSRMPTSVERVGVLLTCGCQLGARLANHVPLLA
jgi:hypothetical protein